MHHRSPLVNRLPLVGIAVILLAAGEARGQNGWLPTSWFAQGHVDPKAMFPLAEKDGPWLVLATTFRGEQAREDARRLVHELRGKHKFTAYTHEKSFDFTGNQPGIGVNPDGSPKKMRYANARQVLEVAVLVGDFASAEDPRGQKTLQKIKTLTPASLTNVSTSDRLDSQFLQANPDLGKIAAKPPLHAAILIPNPLLPNDYFTRQEVDAFVLEMNADVTHSLLDCPARYSVRVATFSGAGTFDPNADSGGGGESFVDVGRFIEVLRGSGWKDPQLRGVPRESRLVEAADKAHRLTEALRRAGWQAWEFHDRDTSFVCVGSVDQLAVPQANGRPVVHPEITRIVTGLGPDQTALAQGRIVPRSFDGIMLDLQPKPVEVPRVPSGRR